MPLVPSGAHADHAIKSEVICTDSSEVARKVLRVLALTVGGVASLIGIWGVVLVLGGNRYIDGGGLAGVTVLAIAGAALAWWRPITAGFAMAIAAIGYLSRLWGDLDGWWSAYQDAIRTSGAAENAFWLDNGGAAPARRRAPGPGVGLGGLRPRLAPTWRAHADHRLSSSTEGDLLVSGQLCGTSSGGAALIVPVSCCPFSCRHWLLGSSCARWGTGPSLRSAYRHGDVPDPIGVVMLRMSKTRPGRAPP
jgi:hypothetical protein